MGNALQSCWKALLANDWRGVTHLLENILSDSHDREDLTKFRTGPTVVSQYYYRSDVDPYSPWEKTVSDFYILVCSVGRSGS